MERRLSDRLSGPQAERLRQVVALAAELHVTAWLVGGAVRDALLGRESLDLDLVVEGEARPLAEALAAAWRVKLTVHERFGTHVIEAGEWHLDLATARRETYPHSGALPLVQPATLDDDLRRRDFTLNAMALPLGASLAHLYDPLGGLSDLRQRLVRGLHPATFLDDPTRIIRAARYAARLGCRLEEQTEAWLRVALAEEALGLVSGPRLWGELSRLLSEPTMPDAVALLDRWGALEPLGLDLTAPDELRDVGAVQERLGALATACDRALAALGLLAGSSVSVVAERFGLSSAERAATESAAALALSPPACVFAEGVKSSTLCECLGGESAAGLLALWARHPGARAAVERFVAVRDCRAEVTGDDLRAAGFEPSAGFRPALQAALRVKLDEDANHDEQLATARATLLAWQRDPEP